MFEIRPIRPEEIPAARYLIYTVAHEIFQDTRPLEESIACYDSRGTLEDMDDVQKTYFEQNGTFLVMTHENRLIGTGAIKRLGHDICELKRLWFLKEYRGQGHGYRMTMDLLSFARSRGYRRVRLETDPVAQSAALTFYKRLGFYEIPRYSQHDDETALELKLWEEP